MSKKILLTGASGFVGQHLSRRLKEQGVSLNTISRTKRPGPNSYTWNPGELYLEKEALDAVDGVVHLAGENVLSLRWTQAKKEKILNSRINSTKLLVNEILSRDQLPDFFICASAIGYYGTNPEGICYEEREAGEGFLAEVCIKWEEETKPLVEAGVRVVNLRIGLVLGEDGGALKYMKLPFSLGLGAVLGSGKQKVSWIAIEDLVSIIEFVTTNSISGPVNATHPQTIDMQAFSKSYARSINRPLLFKAPSLVLNLLLGEMARETFLASAAVEPKKLIDNGFEFTYSDINEYFQSLSKD